MRAMVCRRADVSLWHAHVEGHALSWPRDCGCEKARPSMDGRPHRSLVVGRRTGRTDSGTSYGTVPVPNVFDYNERSEVISATMGDPEDEHGYAYDPIGSRKSWSLNALQPKYYYTSTALNQYSFIYQPGDMYFSPQYDNDGNMLAMYGGWLYTWDGEIKGAQSPSSERRATATLRPTRSVGASLAKRQLLPAGQGGPGGR